MINRQEYLGENQERFAFKASCFNNWALSTFQTTFTLPQPLSNCVLKLIDVGDEII